jgi:secreted PhoX family phosphatase
MLKFPRRRLLRAGGAIASLWVAGRSARVRAGAELGLVTDKKGIIDLPPGFSYRILSRSGDRMSDGYRVPGNPDAMGVFAVAGGWALLRNHEVPPGGVEMGPYEPGTAPPSAAYDPEGYGGVTRLVIDPHSLAVRSTNLALAGTHWNCAGGLSPWGWLSCEELFVPRHGYVFLASAQAPALLPAQRIAAYGRFRHEAASVDPATLIAYLSEDREDAAFYRFVPSTSAQPFRGRLQALCVAGRPGFDTNRMSVGQTHPIEWVDVPEPDPSDDTVRYQAHERGAARFVRTEGLWLDGPDLYVCATTGGPIGRGQIFRIRHAGPSMQLTLLVQTTDPSILDMPDNITVSPHGQLYVAEDGLEGNFIRRITKDGEVIDFARNALSTSEFAGPCFSPDGSTLFVNIQHDGLTLAIRGPFARETGGRVAQELRQSAWPVPPGAAGIGAGLTVLALAALGRRKRNNA